MSGNWTLVGETPPKKRATTKGSWPSERYTNWLATQTGAGLRDALAPIRAEVTELKAEVVALKAQQKDFKFRELSSGEGIPAGKLLRA